MIPKSLDTLRIDINSGKVRKAVSICQQDTVQRTLNFLLVNSGNLVDMSNVLFAEILIHKADGAEADNGCVIDGDSIQYTLRTTDVSALGTNQAQLLLTFEDGQTLTTPSFEINVYSKVLNQNVQKSQNEYRALTEQLVLVNEMSNQIGAARDTAIAKATEAEASATAAAESATSANAAKDDVAASATAAATSAGAAAASATLAVNAAGEADTYADNAADSAFEAAQSKDNAASSATAAAASASSASTSSYTATQKASEAVDSATAAETSASNAATSEDNALGYAERAEEAYRKMGEEGLVLGETSSTAYRGDRGKIAYEHSQTTGNPHNTTAAQVGADVAGAAAQAYQQATGYTDTQIANLINGAPSTLDTLKEIADAMAEHEEVVDALNQAIGTKASDVEFQAHQNNSTVHITANERSAWSAKQNATDNSLNTTDKTIVGAINELHSSIIKSHIGMIVQSTTLDTEAKVIAIYGGISWSKIEGRVLVGDGTLDSTHSYTAGNTGGEPEHTLTIDEMPKHRHGNGCVMAADHMVWSSSGMERFLSGNTGYTGNDQPHNIMQPYKVVYIWERTA